MKKVKAWAVFEGGKFIQAHPEDWWAKILVTNSRRRVVPVLITELKQSPKAGGKGRKRRVGNK